MRNYICSHCGAYLDPGENCDCEEIEAIVAATWEKRKVQQENGQLKLNIKEGVLA